MPIFIPDPASWIPLSHLEPRLVTAVRYLLTIARGAFGSMRIIMNQKTCPERVR